MKSKPHLVPENLVKLAPCRPERGQWCEAMGAVIKNGVMHERRGDVFASSKVSLGVAFGERESRENQDDKTLLANFCPWCGAHVIAWEKKAEA